MFRKTLIFFIGVLHMNNVFTEVENSGVSVYGELIGSHISRGYIVSFDTHPLVDYQVTSSIAEVLTGVSVSTDNDLRFSVFSGLLKPLNLAVNTDVIFLNGFE